MELTSDVGLLSLWLMKYGSFMLFFMLTLGIIALPVPEETLMVVAGILMHKGKLNIPFTVLFAYAGAICGISVSYLIGFTAGKYLVQKYGSWLGITADKLEKAHSWFQRFGKWLLFVGYFIPGVRHFTGLIAGMTYMKYSHFALFAYSGAIIWASLFLSLGYFLGNYFFAIYDRLETIDLITIVLVLVACLCAVYLIRKRRNK